MNKFLIIGGSGFIGTHLINALMNQNQIVLNLDISFPKIQKHFSVWKKTDICDFKCLQEQITSFKPEYVIHLAARTDLNGESIDDYQANTTGILNILEILDHVPSLKRVVFTSSMYVCQPGYIPTDFDDYKPHTIYGQSKVLTEQFIKRKNPSYPWAIIRPTSIWGPFFGEPYLLFFKIVLSKKYFHFGDRACIKTYGYIENTISQIFSLLKSSLNQFDKNVFYLGDYEPYDIKEWANEIATFQRIKIFTVPFLLFKLAAWTGDLLQYFKINFPMTSFRLKNMTTDNVLDLSLIYNIVPSLPVSRLEGTKKTIDWLSRGVDNN